MAWEPLGDGSQASDTRGVPASPLQQNGHVRSLTLGPVRFILRAGNLQRSSQRPYGLHGRIEPTRSAGSAISLQQVVHQELRHDMPASRQPVDRVDGRRQVPRGISEAGVLQVEEAHLQRWPVFDDDIGRAQIAVDPVLLGPAVIDLTCRGTKVRGGLVGLQDCSYPDPRAASLLEGIRCRGLSTVGRGASRADERGVDIVCKAASAVPQAWQLAASSATLPVSRAKIDPTDPGADQLTEPVPHSLNSTQIGGRFGKPGRLDSWLQASGIAHRRAEEERADPLYRLQATTK